MLDELSLGELYRMIWQRKWVVVSGAVLGSLLAFLIAMIVPKEYQAEIIVSPVATTPGEQSMGGLGALASAVGGLSSLTGISVPGNTKKAETIAVLQSGALTEKFIAANNLLPVLYEKRWDAQRKTWKSADPEKIPTLWKANRRFSQKIRTVSTDVKTGLVTLTITWTDPAQSAAWANGLVTMTNDYLRQKTIDTAERDIAYLKQEAASTDIVGVKQAIYTIMENEINKEMLARGTEEYALSVIDPAQTPESPSSPRVVLWTIAGMLFGIVLSMMFAIAMPIRVGSGHPPPVGRSERALATND